MNIITAPFRDPSTGDDETSKSKVIPPKPLGEGASPSDALEFLLSSIEKIPVFPDILSDAPATQDTLCLQEHEVPPAPSPDYTSFFGLIMEAASPTPTSLERKRYQDRASFGGPERRVGPPINLSNSPMRQLDSPILCSDGTVRINNSSKGRRNEVSDGDKKAPRSNSHQKPMGQTYPVRVIRRKSASLPILIVDEASFQSNKKTSNATNNSKPNETLKTEEAQTSVKKSAKGKHKKKPRPESPMRASRNNEPKPRTRSISPFKRFLASRKDKSTTRPKSPPKRNLISKEEKPRSRSISPFKRNKAWRSDEPKNRPDRPRPISPFVWTKAQKESKSNPIATTQSRSISPFKRNKERLTEQTNLTTRKEKPLRSKSPPKKSAHHSSTKTFLTASAKGNLLVEI